jgi:hypothetical protein
VREPLVRAHPEDLNFRVGLGETNLRLGQVQRDVGMPAQAAAAWHRACAYFNPSKSLNREHTFFLACCHAGLAGLAPQPGSGQSAAQATDEAEFAMTVLRRAFAMGYANAAAYRTESALDALRDRPDFRLLMMDLEFPAKPFARGD